MKAGLQAPSPRPLEPTLPMQQVSPDLGRPLAEATAPGRLDCVSPPPLRVGWDPLQSLKSLF